MRGRIPLSSRSTANGAPPTARWLALDRSLIRLMASFGVSAAAVRQAVSRMTRQGWLHGTAGGQPRLLHGDRARPPAHRGAEPANLRPGHRVGRTLAPAHLCHRRGEPQAPGATAQGAERAGLGAALPLDLDFAVGYPDRGARGAQTTGTLRSGQPFFERVPRPAERPRVARALLGRDRRSRRRTAAFIARYEPRLRRERERRDLSDEAAFVERLWLVHDYRKFAYVDPGLPSELLPAHWPGTAAAALFREYYAALDDEITTLLSSLHAAS